MLPEVAGLVKAAIPVVIKAAIDSGYPINCVFSSFIRRNITSSQQAFHGLNLCRDISHLAIEELKKANRPDFCFVQVADSSRNNHHFICVKPTQNLDCAKYTSDPIIIDPTYKQFFSFSVMDALVQQALATNPALAPEFNLYRKTYKIDRDKILKSQMAVSMLPTFFVGRMSEITSTVEDFNHMLHKETYNFPEPLCDEMHRILLSFLGRAETMVVVETESQSEPDQHSISKFRFILTVKLQI